MIANTKLEQFTVGQWTVTPALDRIERNGHSETIEPTAMAVLVYLARRAGRVIPADELTANVWSERVVGDDAVYQRIHRLRAVLEDNPHQPRYIETIPKKGYRLVAPVEFLDGVDSNGDAATRRRPALLSAIVIAGLLAVGTYVFWDRAPSDLTEDPASRQPDVKSIAVLPFVDMSDDQSQKYLGDGIAEELIHALSNVPGLRVAARMTNSSVSALGTRTSGVTRKSRDQNSRWPMM